MGHTICIIPGDGIGPEVATAARRVIDASGVSIDWVELPAGAGAVEKFGEVLPDDTVRAIEAHRVALKGPVTTPIGGGFTSVNVGLRKRLNLYAAVRPVRSLPGVKTRYEDVDLVVVRENTEGLYSGLENEITAGVVQSLKIATRTACERIARYAFNYCHERGRKRVTVFHKANILKKSDGLFLTCAREVRDAMANGVEYEELIIDNGCMQLVRDPTRFDVVLMENLYGDIVSDLCAGLVGGLGVVPGANIGDGCAVFEAVHGSAPDIAGQNLANPLALIMSGVMMLNHLGETGAATRIRDAYDAVLAEGNPAELTRDIGGTGGTSTFADALIKRLG
ncbi:MAG: isocitrate/isopropylmalate dehydrogenase family protein [Candidatus Hydrogenedentes bacterium]|nr:isocitrate/isopropylmalate dehydrogenase family protein [Candidatus Hydrogenedentota bacterium]